MSPELLVSAGKKDRNLNLSKSPVISRTAIPNPTGPEENLKIRTSSGMTSDRSKPRVSTPIAAKSDPKTPQATAEIQPKKFTKENPLKVILKKDKISGLGAPHTSTARLHKNSEPKPLKIQVKYDRLTSQTKTSESRASSARPNPKKIPGLPLGPNGLHCHCFK